MAYVSLYRKYRPQTFSEIVGQEHVTRSLVNAIRDDRLHHAYLFTGPRGTGKTSTARILAKSMNCVDGPTPTPCGVCDQCVAITQGTSVDVIELDMASHGGVDDARELRDRARFAPASARRKVYILDEVHMASTAAFNALLKLIEEPPAHVLFAMATTDPQKVLPTIMSRVQRLDLRRVGAADVARRVRDLVGREGGSIDDEALDAVVRAGDGSLRDTESVLEQVLSYAEGGNVTGSDVVEVLGQTPFEATADVVDALVVGDLARAFAAVQDLLDAGTDLRQFTTDLVEHVRDLLVLVVAPTRPDLVDATAERREALVAQAADVSRELLTVAIDELAVALAEMRQAPARLSLELAIAKIAGRAHAAGGGALATSLDVSAASDVVDQPVAVRGDDADDAPSAGPDEDEGDGSTGDAEERTGSTEDLDDPGAPSPAGADDEAGGEQDHRGAPSGDGPPASADASAGARASSGPGEEAASDDEAAPPPDVAPDRPVAEHDAAPPADATSDSAPQPGTEPTPASDRDGPDEDAAGDGATADLARRARERGAAVARDGMPTPATTRPDGPSVDREAPPDADEAAQLAAIVAQWSEVLDLVKAASAKGRGMLDPATPTRLRNRVLVLSYPGGHGFHGRAVASGEFDDVLVTAIEQVADTTVRIDVEVDGAPVHGIVPKDPEPAPDNGSPASRAAARGRRGGPADAPGAGGASAGGDAGGGAGPDDGTAAGSDPAAGNSSAGDAPVEHNPLADLDPGEAMDRAAAALRDRLGATEVGE